MKNIIIFSNNFIINSFKKIKDSFRDCNEYLFVSPQTILPMERAEIESFFPDKVINYLEYGDCISDDQCEKCDDMAFGIENKDLSKLFYQMSFLKNKFIGEKLLENNGNGSVGYVLSDELGVCRKALEEVGFKYVEGENYYYPHDSKSILTIKNKDSVPIYKSIIENGVVLFIGNPGRVIEKLDFHLSYDENETAKYDDGLYRKDVLYITTIHNISKVSFNYDDYNLRVLVDGFIPNNSTDKSFYFDTYNVKMYGTDSIQVNNIRKAFGKNIELFSAIKRIYMPSAKKRKIKRILFAVNCAGPWSSLINISDTDHQLLAIAELASCRPDIDFIYRPHPLADHPTHEGIHAIDRSKEYISCLDLPNLSLSVNASRVSKNRRFLSVSQGSLEEEIKMADIVISEYSNAMIEAGLLGKPFIVANLTNRRNLFESVTALGFLYCNSVDEMLEAIFHIESGENLNKHNNAVKKYNEYIYSS